MPNVVTQQDMFLRIVSKAILGGWDRDIAAGLLSIAGEMFSDEYPEAKDSMVRSVLLEHGFAKAYWPEKAGDVAGHTVGGINTWQYNLQQAVLADDIINYYYQHNYDRPMV